MATQPEAWLDSELDEQQNWPEPLDRNKAQALMHSQPPLNVLHIWYGQLLLALLIVPMLVLAFGAEAWPSVLVGVVAVLLPQRLMVWGVGRSIGQTDSATWLLRLFAWEIGKLVLTLALLGGLAWGLKTTHWLALLLAFVLVLKAGWLAAWLQHRRGAQALK